MIDIEKVKNLLIKLDLKYKATKDKINTNGIILLLNFDKEYEEFNTVNALDVLNKLEKQLAITEKALEMACKEELRGIGVFEEDYGAKEELLHLIEDYKQQSEKEIEDGKS